MFKLTAQLPLVIVIGLSSGAANAFAPVIAAGATAASLGLDLLDKGQALVDISDFVEILEAGSDLEGEISGGDSSASAEQERLIGRINELKNTMLDAGYTYEEVDSSLSNLFSRQSTTAQKIRSLNRTVKALKRVHTKLGSMLGSPQADSATHQAALQTQQSLLHLQMKHYQDLALKEAEERLKEQKTQVENRQYLLLAVKEKLKTSGRFIPKSPLSTVLPNLTVSQVKGIALSLAASALSVGAIFIAFSYYSSVGLVMIKGGFGFLIFSFGIEGVLTLLNRHFGVA